jgi:hypothetical protein
VRSEACAGTDHEPCVTASVNTVPSSANRSSVGIVSRSYPRTWSARTVSSTTRITFGRLSIAPYLDTDG